LALYEVTGCGLCAEEIATLFASDGFMVLNDYVHDAKLAAAMETVASTIRHAPPGKWASSSVGLQHRLRTAHTEALVAEPLLRSSVSFVDTEVLRQYLQYLREGKAETRGMMNEEIQERLTRRLPRHDGVPAMLRDPMYDILLQALAQSPREVSQEVLPLALGHGIECVGITYPSLSHEGTVLAVQQALMKYEQGDYTEAQRAKTRRMIRWLSHNCLAEGVDNGIVPMESVWPSTSSSSVNPLLEGKSHHAATDCCFTYAVALGQLPTVSATSLATARVDEQDAAKTNLEAMVALAGAPSTVLHYLQDSRRLPDGLSDVSLLPSHAQLREVVERDGDDTASPTLFVRLEERGTMSCSHCGAMGHTWHVCTQYITASRPQVGALPPAPVRRPLLTSAEDELTISTHEVVDTVAEAAHYLQLHADGSVMPPNETLAIPNYAPTTPLNIHSIRREQAKPAMHRRALRCGYCSGRHHITQCPRLSDDSNTAERDAVVDERTLEDNKHELFCICCGERGHLYQKCPRIPEGLHPSSHCPICRLAVHKIRHSPQQCPRRASIPSGYTASGVPQKYIQEGDAARRSMSRRLPRRRGSMLMADTFVDQR